MGSVAKASLVIAASGSGGGRGTIASRGNINSDKQGIAYP